MKKSLSLLAVSTLVGTSTSNLKLLFINNFVNTSFKSNQVNNKDISIRGNNEINPFINSTKGIVNDTSITAIAVAPNGNIYVNSLYGLYKSINGIDFQLLIKYQSGSTVKNLIAFASNGNIYVGAMAGLYKSIDDGNSFQLIMNSYSNVTAIAVAPNGNIYVSYGVDENYGLYKSIDDGNSFQLIMKNIINGIRVTTDGIIYAFSNSYNHGLWISADNGNTFNKRNNTSFFAIEVLNNNIIFAINYDGVFKSIDGGSNFNKLNNIHGTAIAVAPNGNIYVGNNYKDFELGLWISADNGNTFNKPNNFKNKEINNIAFAQNGNIYVGGEKSGTIYILDFLSNVIDFNQPDYFGNKYNGFVYKNEQIINIKSDYLKEVIFDGNSITVPIKNLEIKEGQHNFVFFIKDEYKKYLDVFGGNINIRQITFNFWIKNVIKKDKINYSTSKDDTDLLTGLVSDLGNTNNAPIIQTRVKQGSGVHFATLNSKFEDILIDYPNSFYEQGTVDETTNNFTKTGTHQNFSKNLSIKTDGIYHLHLVDVVGNVYDSYLELGKSNWKLQGKFDDQTLNDKANKLNVTIDSHSASQEVKQETNAWLDNYKNISDSIFNSAVLTKGKGFIFTINDLSNGYKEFLDHVTYVDSKTQYAINKTKLHKVVTEIAEKKLQDGLTKVKSFTDNLKVDTSNVVNKSTLDSYTSWMNTYNDFIKNNKETWIKHITEIASRGFATEEQKNQISNHFISLDFKKYLKHVTWTPNEVSSDYDDTYLKNVVWEDNKLLKSTSNDYQQFVELDKLQNDTIDWVSKNIPEINTAYQNALNQAESGLNLHGYSVDTFLHGKNLPQTKSEIENFADGQSFHDWLQAKADNMYHIWQLKVGVPIGLILLGVTVFASLACYWKFSARHNPIKRADKKHKPINPKK